MSRQTRWQVVGLLLMQAACVEGRIVPIGVVGAPGDGNAASPNSVAAGDGNSVGPSQPPAVPAAPDTPLAPGSGPQLSVDANTSRHPISFDIYGVNANGNQSLALELKLPVQRWGGDATTRYNWQLDSSNAGLDWFFMGGGNAQPTPGAGADAFIAANAQSQSKSVLTIPVLPYVNAFTATDCVYPYGHPLRVYPASQAYNPYVHPIYTDPNTQQTTQYSCGNGIDPNGNDIPLTAQQKLEGSLLNSVDLQRGWLQHLLAVHGPARAGGVQIYQMDNEPFGWGNTHRDVHPGSTGYDELLDLTLSMAAMVKSMDPTAKVLGPSDFGVPAYYDSGKSGDDAAAHGGTPYAVYYLQQMALYEQQHGTRVLDYFDEHYYPSEANIANQPTGDANDQAMRLRCVRSLWDPNYTDESWIGLYSQAKQIQLIPRLKAWVHDNYPGTLVAITEYNFGGFDSINGALAQADVLGVFAREGLDLATLWGTPLSTDPGAFAFNAYLNYDGQGAQFGETWVQTASVDQAQLAAYGAQRACDGALTVVVINKTGGDITSALTLANFTAGLTARVFSYSTADLTRLTQRPSQAMSARGLTLTYPANAITVLEIPNAQATASTCVSRYAR